MSTIVDTALRPHPFHTFHADIQSQDALRAAITRHTRAPESACVAALLEAARLPPQAASRARATALSLVEAVRARAASAPSRVWCANTTAPAMRASP